MPETRQLAAIMFTDIVGYTALMGENEASAYQLLKRNRQVQKPIIRKYGGKWLKEMGDGVLASFQTVSDAVYCAIEIQLYCKKEPDLKLKIGIHQGEVMVEEGDVFGNGVNIASRLEPLTPAGSIYVSESVFRNIENKQGIKAEFVREETLKNVRYPVRIYEVKVENIEAETQPNIQESFRSKESGKRSNFWKVIFALFATTIIFLLIYFLYLKPDIEPTDVSLVRYENEDLSIAVLPFKNWSGDPELEPFCDGMTDAVISRLTKLEGISKVISMTSVMSFKQTQKTMPLIAAELGVTHILEANFQKSGDQVKINLQLIDGPSDNSYWASEYTGEWGIGIFEIQAAVAENVAKNMGAQITDSEIKSIQSIPTYNEEAYNIFIQAEFQRHKFTEAAFKNAIPLYNKVIALDSNFTEAYIGLANIWNFGGYVWGIHSEREAWQNAKSLLQKALDIDSTNQSVLSELSQGLFYYEWNFDLTEHYYKKFDINSDYLIKTGRFNEALEDANRRILRDPSRGVIYAFKAEILMFQGKTIEALEILEKNDPLYMDDWWYLREAAKLYYYMGEYQKSKNHLSTIRNDFREDIPPIIFWLSAVHHQIEGDTLEVDRSLYKLKEYFDNKASGSPAWFIAMYYCHLKDYEMAFEWLQNSFERHEVEMTWLREEPLLIPVREDPRYKDLYNKIGFPDVLTANSYD
jgi:class 3 adenylate cyclase/TolB-like protein